MIYLTGCTHFGHANIIRLAHRPFGSIEEMDQALIDNWNSTVRTKDEVYHVGDFAWSNHADYKRRLNGHITCLQGNHDPRGWGDHLLEFKHNKRRIVLCHYPIEEWNGWYRGALHFHAHTHKKTFRSAERRGNVGVDATGYTPIALDQAIDLLG